MSEAVAESATAAENGEQENDSMEKLQIDDEDEKNVSVEDILGGNTLIMSDSEDETPATLANKNQGEDDEEMEKEEAEKMQEHIKSKSKKKKISAIIDSDSDEEQATKSEQDQENTRVSKTKLSAIIDSDNEEDQATKSDQDQETARVSKKKISAIIDSDSEEEQATKDGQDQESTRVSKTKLSAIIDSGNEEQKEQATKSRQSTETTRVSKKKISAIIDSESEGEQATKSVQHEESTSVSKKKISAIIDSDSEEEQSEKSKEKEEVSKLKSKKKISAIVDTDSEEEPQVNSEEDELSSTSTKKQKSKKKQRMDSDEEQDTSSSDDGEKPSKLKGLVDSESEEETGEPMEQQAENEAPKTKSKSKPMRASAKKALDEMQAIQSEQQRLHREAHISVPYHQPKPRTLKEFLSRRTINKPLAVAMAGGSPMPSKQKEPRRSLALRMNTEELQAYAKLMEERAKEATEFFKSESEPEDDEKDESEPKALEDKTVEEEQTTALESEVEASSAIPESEIEAISVDVEAENAMESEPIVETISPTKVQLVTEVVELPKLDLSTLNITPPSKPSTPRISEAIRRLRDEKSNDVSPSLKGDPNMVIDLETGDMFAKKPTGVDDLLLRLMKTREAKKHKTTETVNILSTTHGKLELSKVSIHLHEEEPVNKEQKPGAAYQKMQEHLKSLINKKRMEDMRKKQAEEMQQAEEDDEMEVDEDEEYEPDEKPAKSQVVINDDEEIIEEDGEVNVEEDETADDAEQEADAEPETEANEEEASSSSEDDEESETEETQTQGKRKNRIIRAFQDDNSDDDLLQTPKLNKTVPLTATQLQLSAQKLFDTEVERTASDEENELLGLCSGRFTQSEMSSTAPTTSSALISQIPITQAPESSQAPDELEALCSGNFETQKPASPEPTTNKIVSSEEEAAEQQKEEKPRQKKLTKKRQKKKALGFSDDEESEEESAAEEQLESEAEEVEEVPESFVDYDSEENEVVVQMTKKDRKLRASNFLEKEAELSESEWGSADEDEKNLDNYDIELGDEDEFDKEKLRSELGQIHARKMLDQDIREVRKIQDMLFEDEEGAVRQRQFRWKNAENGMAFSLDDTRNAEGEADPNEGSGDEENEHLWRKIRYEREQLLLEKGLKGAATNVASPLSPAVGNTNTARKFNIITAKKTTVELKKSSPFLISKSVNQKQQAVRGSFLVRDKETLTKLAGLTKGAAGDVDGTAGTVSVKSTKAKNFVFATLTEEEHENQKRKAADLLNSSSETGVNFMKKPRLEPRREKCLIDQLL
ncbi:claspin [Drosophila sulfurigaster albostrigata]|uniref:claspin n=1 Tax=Drosophila sulfurigaster albostrigata TaxID=89887 RepID=UPI002D21C4CC|nr:claspin [Drosophila sulfurigaster albostrigata]